MQSIEAEFSTGVLACQTCGTVDVAGSGGDGGNGGNGGPTDDSSGMVILAGIVLALAAAGVFIL